MPPSNWIPVSERLPEFYRHVVVYFVPNCHDPADVREERRVATAERIEAQAFGNNATPYAWRIAGPCTRFGQEVTHWQPLPDPPEKESE